MMLGKYERVGRTQEGKTEKKVSEKPDQFILN